MSVQRTQETQYSTSCKSSNLEEAQTLNLASLGRQLKGRELSSSGFVNKPSSGSKAFFSEGRDRFRRFFLL